MENKIKIGIIGCGGIANGAHKPPYDSMEDVEIVACCDIIKDRAVSLAKHFGNDESKAFTDYKEMIEKVELDAVDICTPNYLHSIIAVYALEHGLNVFCEKPDAISVAEAENMKAAAEKSGKMLMVMRNNRYMPSSTYLRKYIDAGKMGEIYTARCAWRRRRGIPGKGGWFTTKEQSGGGPLIDLGVHMIDLAMWLMGNPTPVAVSGATYCKFANDESESDSIHSKFGDAVKGGTFDVEDLAMGFIRFDNGAVLQIEFSWASNIEKECTFVELRGTKSGAYLQYDEPTLKIFTEENGCSVDIQPKFAPAPSGHESNLRHFVDCLKNGTKPMFVPEQGVNMVKILEAIYKSAEIGKEVIL